MDSYSTRRSIAGDRGIPHFGFKTLKRHVKTNGHKRGLSEVIPLDEQGGEAGKLSKSNQQIKAPIPEFENLSEGQSRGSTPLGGTYLLRDPATGQVMRTGRTKNLERRAKEHRRSDETADLYDFFGYQQK